MGVHKANGGLFFIVDSDDFLANNAMDLTFKSWQEIRNDITICGLIGLSEFTNGKIVGDKFTHDNWDIPFIDFYLKYHLTGDKSVAFKTEVMKEYPFPEKEGVRYVFEAVVWHEMSKKYKVRCLNTVIQFKEYLDEGISDSSYKMWYLKSMAFSYFNLIENKTYSFSKYPKEYYMNFVYLGVYSLLIKENYFNQLHSFKSKLVFLLVVPRAVFSYFRMRDKVIN